MVLQVGSGSTGGDGVVVFRVEVNHSAARHKIGRNVGGSCHTVFLVGGDKQFKRTVLQRRALHHGKRHAKSHAVVGTQRSAACLHPTIFNICLYSIVQGVEGLALFGHTDHIHVGMQHGDGSVGKPWCTGFTDEHAVMCIALVIQLVLLGKLAKPVGHTFFMPRRSGHLVQLME